MITSTGHLWSSHLKKTQHLWQLRWPYGLCWLLKTEVQTFAQSLVLDGTAFIQFRKEGVEGHALLVNLQGFSTRQMVRSEAPWTAGLRGGHHCRVCFQSFWVHIVCGIIEAVPISCLKMIGSFLAQLLNIRKLQYKAFLWYLLKTVQARLQKNMSSWFQYSTIYQWIGLRENLQETIDFPIQYGVFL